MAGYGIVEQQSQGMRFMGNAELDRRDRDKVEQAGDKSQSKSEVISLAGHIRQGFTLAINSKQPIQEEMMKALRQRNGVYEQDILRGIIAQGGTKIYMMITDVKCRALESYLKDIMLPGGEPPFAVESTVIPEIKPEVAKEAWLQLVKELEAKLIQQSGPAGAGMITEEMLREEGEKLKNELVKQLKEIADDAAKGLTKQINDEFQEGGWYEAMDQFIDDLATYPAGFIVGPTYRKKPTISWEPIPGTQLSQMKVVSKIVKEYNRFDPFDVYASPGACSVQEGGLYLRMRYRRSDLVQMKGVPGYNDDTIDMVLSRYGTSGYRDFIYSDTEHADLLDRPMETQDPIARLDGVKYFGSVQGLLLRQWGMTREQIPNPFDEYNISAILIGQYVIMSRINHHPLGKRPIYSASYKRKNGSVWGQAPPYLMRDIASFCNAAARAICNNFAIASGPQVWINVDRMSPGTDIQQIFPWKIWPFANPKVGSATSGDKPMDFYQPQVITDQLMAAYDYFFKQASEITGIPAFTSENLRGAGKTARGLAMLRNDAARGIRSVARNIDTGVISKSVEEHWLSIVLEDPSKADGDTKIVARASDYLVQQEQLEMRRNEMLDRTNNPTDLQIMGIGGRAELLRANARSLKIDPDKIIPPKEDMINNIVQARMQQLVLALAQALNIPPEQIMQLLQDPAAQPGDRRIASTETDGSPVQKEEIA